LSDSLLRPGLLQAGLPGPPPWFRHHITVNSPRGRRAAAARRRDPEPALFLPPHFDPTPRRAELIRQVGEFT